MAVDPRRLEGELLKLLGANNHDVQEATANLKSAYFDQASIVPALAEFVCTSPIADVRKLAAVLLRQRATRLWLLQPPATKAMIKAALLDRVVNETNDQVRHQVAAAVATIAQHELPAGTWPEVMNTVMQCCVSPTKSIREEGAFLLASVVESVGDRLRPHYTQLFELFFRMMQDEESLQPRVKAMKCVASLAGTMKKKDEEALSLVRYCLPAMFATLRVVITSGDDALTTDAFDVFDDLTETTTGLLNPSHYHDLITLFVETAQSASFDNAVRIRALVFIQWVARYKRKTLKKTGLLAPLVAVLLRIMSDEPLDSEAGANGDSDDDDDDEEDKPSDAASQTLDTFALYLAADDFMPFVMTEIRGLMSSGSPAQQRACMMAIVIIAEGCLEFVSDHMDDFLAYLYAGLASASMSVRATACMAVSAVSEADGMAQHHAQLLPALAQVLATSNENVQDKCCVAIERYCEQMGEDVVHYMDGILKALGGLLSGTSNRQIHESVICAIGSVAHAAEGAFAPYFADLTNVFVSAMSMRMESDIELRSIATGTIGTLAVAIGKEAFLPHLPTFHALAWNGLETIDEPRLRECTWEFYANLARCYGVDFESVLPGVLEPLVALMIRSALSNDGIAETRAQADVLAGDDEEGDNADGFVVATAFLDDKELAVAALGEFYEYTRRSMLPYTKRVLDTLVELNGYFHHDVRKAAVLSYGQIIKAYHDIFVGETPWSRQKDQVAAPELLEVTAVVVPILIGVMDTDQDRMAVLEACRVFNDMLRHVGPALVPQQQMHPLGASLLRLVKKEARCQNREEEVEDEYAQNDAEAEEDEAELDAALMDGVCDALAAFSKAIGAPFYPLFEAAYPYIRRYFKQGRKENDKSMCTGVLAEIVAGLKEAIAPLVEKILKEVFFPGLKDESREVRRNAAYGVGLVCEHLPNTVQVAYPDFLERLAPLIEHHAMDPEEEDESSEYFVDRDNAVGAIARMIYGNPAAATPLLGRIVTLLSKGLPVKNDEGECKPVYRGLSVLMEMQPAMFVQQSTYLIKVTLSMLTIVKQPRESTLMGIEFLKAFAQLLHQHDRWQATQQALSPDEIRVLNAALE